MASVFKTNTLLRDPNTGLGRVFVAGEKVPSWVDRELVKGSIKNKKDDDPAPDPQGDGGSGDGGSGDDGDEFNPDDHTVPQVLEYLEDKDQDEVDRVQAVEAQGQDRKGIRDFELGSD